MLMPFHLAIPVSDLEVTKKFYTDVLGSKEGRSSDKWCDFNFFGHQLTAHLCPGEVKQVDSNIVDGAPLPVRHFGIVLSWDNWHDLKDRLEKKSISFIADPHIRFKGEVGEQATMFFMIHLIMLLNLNPLKGFLSCLSHLISSKISWMKVINL